MGVENRYYQISNGLMCLFILLLWLCLSVAHAKTADILKLQVKGGIGPATADYIARGIDKGQDATLILIELDTPGGLSQSTRLIVKSILASNTPILTFVAPSGARAASAGTFILYASTIAAMAPGTHLGAASPVNMMGAMGSDQKDSKKPSKMDKKVMNDSVAYIRTLAEHRKRDVHFAEQAVLNAATMTATEAKKAGVINVVANDDATLFNKLDGQVVAQNGRDIKLDLKNAKIQLFEPDWRMKFLLVITDPTLAYLLLLLGIYGIFFELVNPGFVAPGVIGALAMVVALYALQMLPVNYAGMALIVLGVIFMIAEALVPSFGVLGFGGTIAFIIGSVMLVDTPEPAYQIALSAIGAMAAANIIIFVVVLGMAIKARRAPIHHGTNTLIGHTGRTISTVDPEGQAIIRGEIWWVKASQKIDENESIRVIGTDGLKLYVIEDKGV